jgi:prevent-host-death family protein
MAATGLSQHYGAFSIGQFNGQKYMPGMSGDEVSIGVTAFKARCLAVIDEVAKGKTRRVVLTKHNRPIAAIVRSRKSWQSCGARCAAPSPLRLAPT